jgi:hypothetical protein
MTAMDLRTRWVAEISLVIVVSRPPTIPPPSLGMTAQSQLPRSGDHERARK